MLAKFGRLEDIPAEELSERFHIPAEQLDEQRRIREHVNVFVNGERVREDVGVAPADVLHVLRSPELFSSRAMFTVMMNGGGATFSWLMRIALLCGCSKYYPMALGRRQARHESRPNQDGR